MKFNEFELDPSILEALDYMGFDEATPVQEVAIPAIMSGKDVMAFAQTGTGKTAAFVLPLLHKIMAENPGGVQALVLVPTRELAIQIDQQIQGFSYFLPVHSATVYGGGDGKDWDQQKKALKEGAEIIIATPGKLISHLNMGYVDFKNLRYLVLDEADRMLDMGFMEDIKHITAKLPAERQTLMFSATMPPKIRSLARNIMRDPVEINIAISKPAEGVIQAVYHTREQDKAPLLTSLLQGKKSYNRVLIFCSTKRKVFSLYNQLKSQYEQVEMISSDLDQKEREEVLLHFRSGQTKILIATDVLSRGLDIKDINLIINYDVPPDAEDYIHRIGRTARASSTGVALTFVTPDDIQRLKNIEKLIGKSIPSYKWKAGK